MSERTWADQKEGIDNGHPLWASSGEDAVHDEAGEADHEARHLQADTHGGRHAPWDEVEGDQAAVFRPGLGWVGMGLGPGQQV